MISFPTTACAPSTSSSAVSDAPSLKTRLQNHYSREKYNEKGTYVASRLLHFLIVLKQPENTILKTIQDLSIAPQKKGRIHFQDPEQDGLSPLWLAVIHQNESAIKALQEHDATLLTQDAFGFTPLHYAALRGKTALDELVACVGEATLNQLKPLRCSFGGTYEDLLTLTTGRVADISQLIWNQSPMDPEQFQKLTGAQFGTYASREELLHAHRIALVKPEPLSNHEIEASDSLVTDLIEHPPRLELIEEQGMGYGIAAIDTIPANSGICFYGGNFISDHLADPENRTHEQSVYWMDHADAFQMRGIGACVNEGPPNAQMIKVRNDRGLPFTTALVALQEIQPGEEIHIFYGHDHMLRDSKYLLTQNMMKRLTQFFQKKDALKKLVSNYKKMINNILACSLKDQLKTGLSKNIGMLLYVFHTPTVFFRLHIDGILNEKTTLKLINKFKNIQEGTFSFFDCYETTLPLIQNASEGLRSQLREMLGSMTGRSFAHALNLLAKNNQLLTQHTLQQATINGLLFDQLYLMFNGSLHSDFVESKSRVDQKEHLPFDATSYHNLPRFFKRFLLDAVEDYIENAAEKDLDPEVFKTIKKQMMSQ